jgi:cation diffusion facilitator family transporter
MLLMGVKLGIVIASSSLVLIASLIDSVLDIVSSFVLYFASKSSLAKNKYKYPVGKHRLEPLGIVAFSAIMGMTSLIIILESIKGIVDGYTSSSEVTVEFSYIAAIVLGIVIVVKLCLYFLCKYIQHRIMQLSGGRINHTVEAMYEDHINDVVSNAFALVIALISSNYNSVWVLDPLGALLIAAIIMKGWLQKGAQQGKLLVGRSASNEFIGKLAFLAIKHDDRILAVDTIYAYHSGINLIVEIHIVLPEEMPLRIAHDIGDSLERRLEALPSVERAFVHMDIDFLHKPEH